MNKCSVANAFSIWEINFNNLSRFHKLQNLREGVVHARQWLGEGKGVLFDFTCIFSGPEVGHQYSLEHHLWAAYCCLGDPDDFAELPMYYDKFISRMPYPEMLPARNVTLTTMKDTMEGTVLDRQLWLVAIDGVVWQDSVLQSNVVRQQQ